MLNESDAEGRCVRKQTGGGRQMKKQDVRHLKELAYYSSIGLSVALSIFIGLGIGVFLDRRYESNPWCTLIFLGLGIAAGYRNIGLAIKKSRKY